MTTLIVLFVVYAVAAVIRKELGTEQGAAAGRELHRRVRDGEAGSYEVLSGLSLHNRVEALRVARRLFLLDDMSLEAREASARLAALDGNVQVDPYDIELALQQGHHEDAVRMARERLAEHPRNIDHRLEFADVLRRIGRQEELISMLAAGDTENPEIASELCAALVEAGRSEEALRYIERALAARPVGTSLQVDAHKRAQDQLHAMKSSIDAPASSAARAFAVRGVLDPTAANNYALIAADAMAESPRLADRLELRSVEDELEQVETVYMTGTGTPSDLTVAGSVALRSGEYARAERLFREALQAQPGHFPALRGMAAAMRDGRNRAFKKASALSRDEAGDWARVVSGFEVLTDAERRVVRASAQPVRHVIGALLHEGVRLHLLPLDVRLEDVPSHDEQLETPPRAWHVGIEDVLDLSSETGWCLARALAKLSWWRLSVDQQVAFMELFNEVQGTPHIAVAYPGDIDDFFAAAVVQALAERHAPAGRRERREPIEGRIRALVDALAADG